MQYFRLTLISFILIAFLGTCLTACSPPPPKLEDLTGKWVAIKKEKYLLGGGGQVGFEIEFFQDKTIMLPSGKGKWDILPDGRVKIEVTGMTMHGSLQEKILTITMPKDQGKVFFKKK